MLPISAKQIADLYQKALKLQNSGKLNEALACYRTIFTANPRIAEVHFQVARIFSAAGKHDQAVPHLKEANKLKPAEVAIWQLLAENLQALADKKQISAFLKNLAGSKLGLGQKARIGGVFNAASPSKGSKMAGVSENEIAAIIFLMNSGKFEQAEVQAVAHLKSHKNSATLLHILATAQARQNKTEAALANFRRATQIDPKSAIIHNDLGRFLLDLGRPVEAIEELRRALINDENMTAAMLNLARTRTLLGQNDDAINLARKACKTDPALAEAHSLYASLLITAAREAEAIDAYQKAIDLGEASAQNYAMMALAQGALNQNEEALRNFAKAIEIAPDYAFSYFRRATLLQNLGDFEAADADFHKALTLDPDNGEIYRTYGATHKFSADDPLIAQMASRYKDAELSDVNRMNLGFAISKAMEDCKEYNKVFPYLNTANALMCKAYPYDVNSRKIEIEKIRQAFSGVDFIATQNEETSDFAPIFITGMPRSGTTLVEQILASHSTVTGAGEVGEFSRQAYKMTATPDGAFNAVSNMSSKAMADLGSGYADFMRNLFPDGVRISDKSIQTYAIMGFVKLALPRAHVVVVRRDPRDNLLSIYKNVFPEGSHRYAYNLRDLGTYYKLFVEMIDFWRSTLPGYFHEIHYDALIANPKDETRKLLAACDLEWEDNCLNFHQNKRRVDTLSVYQVRQPIYQSSLKAWERYEDDLAELFTALE